MRISDSQAAVAASLDNRFLDEEEEFVSEIEELAVNAIELVATLVTKDALHMLIKQAVFPIVNALTHFILLTKGQVRRGGYDLALSSLHRCVLSPARSGGFLGEASELVFKQRGRGRDECEVNQASRSWASILTNREVRGSDDASVDDRCREVPS